MEPVRTCVGCRTRCDRAELLRLTVVDAVVHVDRTGHAPGRGVYLHPNPDCWDKAVGRRAVGRALRTPAADTSGLSAELMEIAGSFVAGPTDPPLR